MRKQLNYSEIQAQTSSNNIKIKIKLSQKNIGF